MFEWLNSEDLQEAVALRHPYFERQGIPECSISWNDVILASFAEPEFLGKGGFVDEKTLAPGCVRAFAEEVNKLYPSRTGDVSIHMYGSFIKEANTNGKHRDTANVFLIGALGTTDYTIFNDDDTAQVNYTVGPGDVLYIPRSRWHLPEPLEPRAVFSIGLEYGRHVDDDG